MATTGDSDGERQPGATGLSDHEWAQLAQQVTSGDFTPVLGPLLSREILGSREDIARRWVRDADLPLLQQRAGDLAQVCQYVRVIEGAKGDEKVREALRWQIREEMRRRRDKWRDEDPTWDLEDYLVAPVDPSPVIMEVGQRLRLKDPDDPYRILAKLKTPIYVTTAWTDLLQGALSEKGANEKPKRTPITMGFKWQGPVETRARTRPERPTVERPFVYHLFGRLDDLSSLVLSEDDYFTWLYGWSMRHSKSVPPSVLEALTNKSLIFLGYRLEDWDFRVLFQSIWKLAGSTRLKRKPHVVVQFRQESQVFERTAVEGYMESYFGAANVSIYWGETREFLIELRHRLAP